MNPENQDQNPLEARGNVIETRNFAIPSIPNRISFTGNLTRQRVREIFDLLSSASDGIEDLRTAAHAMRDAINRLQDFKRLIVELKSDPVNLRKFQRGLSMFEMNDLNIFLDSINTGCPSVFFNSHSENRYNAVQMRRLNDNSDE